MIGANKRTRVPVPVVPRYPVRPAPTRPQPVPTRAGLYPWRVRVRVVIALPVTNRIELWWANEAHSSSSLFCKVSINRFYRFSGTPLTSL